MTTPAPQTISREGILSIYPIKLGLLNSWTSDPRFPPVIREERAPGQTGGSAQPLYLAAEVDAFVEEHFPLEWLQAHEGADAVAQEILRRLPKGNPADLLNLKEFGEVFGNFTRGKPLGASTMRSYLSRGQIPAPDRVPDDKQDPEVYEANWYRATIYAFLAERTGRGGRGKSRARQVGQSSDPSLIGKLPDGSPDDLLTLEEAGIVVGNYSRGKPYPPVTMTTYKNTGRIPEPDRLPDDGQLPTVKKPSYRRSTVNAIAEAQGAIARG